jgi:hypothetical protein
MNRGRFILSFLTPIAALLAISCATCIGSTNSFPAYERPVMTWVPRYAASNCLERLSETYSGIGMKDALTHVGLQFWTPTNQGALTRSGKGETTSDAVIKAFRDWGRTNGIRILLCVYQIGDWELARSAFKDNCDTFIESLLTEVNQHDLDGVDIDFEGRGRLNEDKEAFVNFIRQLATRLHKDNRHLTVDSYAYLWNAPNQTWWPNLLPHVDGLTTMGYDQTGSRDTDWRGYASQKKAAGEFASKLMIGLPSHKGEWRGASLSEHLKWLVSDGEVGVAFWDAQLRSANWRKPDVWKSLQTVQSTPE